MATSYYPLGSAAAKKAYQAVIGITGVERSKNLTSQLANAIKRNPLGRAAEPGDIAEVVLFLASEKNRFINGETVIVNGGATMV